MSIVTWWLDIEEADGNVFSVGAVFGSGNTISPVTLVDRFQRAFDLAVQRGEANRQYYFEARVAGLGGTGLYSGIGNYSVAHTDGFGMGAMGGFGAGTPSTTNKKELIIQYRIYRDSGTGHWLAGGSGDPDGNEPFRVLLRTGPHGMFGAQFEAPGERGALPFATVIADNQPSIVAFETPYCRINATVTDKPPVPPDILFVPFVGVNNKVMILFNSNAGEKFERPIALRDSDGPAIMTAIQAQHPDTTTLQNFKQKKLQYRNDDPIRKYELFKVANPPTSYESFKGRYVTSAPLQAELGPDKFSTGVTYVDNIVPNKKFWYCARSIDIHNNISNPTFIFEVEMVDNKGQMFMRQKIFSFKPKKLDYKKAGRRYLAIEPRYEQMVYDQAAEQPGNVALNQAPSSDILGTSAVRNVSSVWGKKFKVRVTSKKTGRKIDLNVAFKNTGVVIP